MRIFIGYDEREKIASEVCEFSIRKHWPDASIRHLKLDDPDVAEVYDRSYWTEHGQKIDKLDGRPFSTDFAFSRFLVPYLSDYRGWSLFCDCDFLFLADPRALYTHADESYAVMCVKHLHVPRETKKMDDQAQVAYHRKNWSSLMLFNCGHPALARVNPHMVNDMPGSFLHQFSWLQNAQIGEIPEVWNWLADASPTTELGRGAGRQDIKAIHYTEGGPWFSDYDDCEFADEWFAALGDMDGGDFE